MWRLACVTWPRGGEALVAPSVIEDLPQWGVVLECRDTTIRGVEKPVPASLIGMAVAEGCRMLDPICGIPLFESTAEEWAHDAKGAQVLFCSAGCLDTWQRRPVSAGRPGPAAR
jgi:YHS domain-containing protein